MIRPLASQANSPAGGLPAHSKGLEICDHVEGLATLDAPGTELVIWRRILDPDLHGWLAGLDHALLPDFRILLQPRDLSAAIEPYLDDSGMPAGNMRDLFIRDIDDLVSAFARLASADLVDIRLERIRHDACWKFHRDRVELRLLTTYLGPATQWVQPGQAEQALRDQRDYGGPLEQLHDHDVAVFKGSNAGPGSGIVHRSPPIEGTGQTRLLLCLNKQSAASPAPWSPDSD